MAEISKPKVLMLIDTYGWAFHALAKGIKAYLQNQFTIDIVAKLSEPIPDITNYDILHIFGVRNHNVKKDEIGKCIVIKSLFNTARRLDDEDILDFHKKYTSDAHVLTVPIASMHQEMEDLPIPVYIIPEGVDTKVFTHSSIPTGNIKIGWAGNPSKTYKRFWIAQSVCTQNNYDFYVADGTRDEKEMIKFYNEIDVILCSAKYGEGCPRPLLEGMACGCFAISSPVGVAPEIIEQQVNGLLVEDQAIDGFRSSLHWCSSNLALIQERREANSKRIRQLRDWSQIAPKTGYLYNLLLVNERR